MLACSPLTKARELATEDVMFCQKISQIINLLRATIRRRLENY